MTDKLLSGERCDYVNDSLTLIQKPDGLTFGTDALLLAGYVAGRFAHATELGGGSGIISMLLLTRDKAKKCTVLEIQEEYADLIERNALINSLCDRMHAVCEDVREYAPSEECDMVLTNPPYMKADAGANNKNDAKSIARHEIHGSIYDFTHAAKRILKFGGAFYAVYRPDRLSDIMDAMRKESLEPKRMTFVHSDAYSESSMVLIEAKAGAKSGMQLTRPLIIYKDKSHKEYSDEMNYIMEHGSFPESFKR